MLSVAHNLSPDAIGLNDRFRAESSVSSDSNTRRLNQKRPSAKLSDSRRTVNPRVINLKDVMKHMLKRKLAIIRLQLKVCLSAAFIVIFNCVCEAQPTEAKTTSQTDQQTEDASLSQTPEVLTARGRVFVDADGDGRFSDRDQPFAGIKVSNGKEIVKTGSGGKYEIPIGQNSIVFLLKPTGFRSPLDEHNLPQFYYIHKPDGSPKLKYAGSKPTGTLPDSIDFPLYPNEEPETFRIVLFGDPQPRDMTEVDYIAQDVVSELIGCDHAFGISLGDLAFDHLETLEPMNQVIGLIGIPWHNVIGNHDLNLDAKDRDGINETFESIYGPTYYSFDHGNVHFVVLDNIDWQAPAETPDKKRFFPRFGERQLEFVKRDLSLIPDSQMVVLLMHVPIVDTEDRQKLFRLIEQRPLCVSVAAHTHQQTHYFLGKEDGFHGVKEHHHIVNVTVSGAWWSGAKDDRGIPHSTMRDGAPNGYSIMTFEPNRYLLDFKGAGHPADYQMRVHVPNAVTSAESATTDIWVNVFNGSTKSRVEMAIDRDSEWVELNQKMTVDPYYQAIVESEKVIKPAIEPSLIRPGDCSHLWKGVIGKALEPGVHLIRVRTTDMHGRTFYAQRSIRITPDSRAENSDSANDPKLQ